MNPAAVSLRRPLLRWYRRNHRRLPWRETRDPYAVWVAETMLQQTRTETVLRYYPRFLERFRTVHDLARARESSVLAVWSGLGYYGRARNLHRAAHIVVRDHGGLVPSDPEALRSLPGVGRYTAGAVASIAGGVAVPVLDGNVARVLARLFAIRGRLRTGATERRLWDLAGRLVPERRPGDWNQALMELGATVCLPRRPACPRCPVRLVCRARAMGETNRLPVRARRRPVVAASEAAVVVESGGRVLLVRREGRRLLNRLWAFPDPSELIRLGVPVRPRGRPRAIVRHTILHRRIETRVYHVAARSAPAVDGARWVPISRLKTLPLSAVGLRIAAALAPPFP